MFSMLEPRQTLFKLITDVVSKHNIPIDTIKPGIDKLVRGMSDADCVSKKRPKVEDIEGTTKSFLQNAHNGDYVEQETGPRDSESILTIHVFDEAKKAQKDFSCPRGILLKEMKYFKTLLTNSTAQSKDVDIAVHCDLEIFNWLIDYAKRPIRESQVLPSFLEPSNWASVLISANFLQMDHLVDDCILFCKNRIDDIILSPSSFQCIEDNLITRISQCFSPNELDKISDPKDKIKSKLFAKKVNNLFDPTTSGKVVKLFRCSACKSLLSNVASTQIACIPSRTCVGKDGCSVHAKHLVDKNFKVDDFILDLKRGRSWSELYWIVWSCINHLTCSKCSQVFMCHNISSCLYHSEMPKSEVHAPHITTYSCCDLNVSTFDPLQAIIKKGCKVRDHIVNLPDQSHTTTTTTTARNETTISAEIYQSLLNHKDTILSLFQGGKYQAVPKAGLELFGPEENLSIQTKKVASSIWGESDQSSAKSLMIVEEEHESLGSDGNSADEEQLSKAAREKKVKSGKDSGLGRRNMQKDAKWDINKSLRYNQDAQRQEDQKRMRELSQYLMSFRFNQDDVKKYKHKSFAGGIFSKLETQWKSAQISSMKVNQMSSSKPKITKNHNK